MAANKLTFRTRVTFFSQVDPELFDFLANLDREAFSEMTVAAIRLWYDAKNESVKSPLLSPSSQNLITGIESRKVEARTGTADSPGLSDEASARPKQNDPVMLDLEESILEGVSVHSSKVG